MNTMTLYLGENKITVTQVAQSCHQYINNWNAFVWYITDYATVSKYDKNWVIVQIKSKKLLRDFSKILEEYDPEIWEHNFEIDIENDLFLTHKSGMQENRDIIFQLAGRKNSNTERRLPMSITYIDELNTLESNKKYAIIDLNDIFLDVNNPRFSSTTLMGKDRIATQQDIISYLLRYGKLLELTDSISNNNDLYAEEWLSCVINPEGQVIVLEGNRRIAACKIMSDPSLIPEDLKKDYKVGGITEQTLNSINRIRAIIYDNEKDAQNYIAAKHTKFEIKHWEPVEQCNYYYSQFNSGKNLTDIMTNTGDDIKSIQDKIKWFGIFKEVFNVVTEKHPNILIEDVNILPLATKFFPPIASKNAKVGLNLTYDKTTFRYSSLPEKADIYKKILLSIGEAFFVRPKGINADLSERASSDTYRISTNEIKNKNQVETLIVNDIRIPGLIKLIQEYKEITYNKSTDEAAASKEDTPREEEKSTPSKPNTPPQASTASNQRAASTDRTPEFFSDLKYEHLSPVKYPGLHSVCDEIKRISSYNSCAGYKQFPISSTFLLRSLIEQTLSERLKQKNRYQMNTSKNGHMRSPQLDSIISIYLKDVHSGNYTLFWDDTNLASEFNKCFSGYGTKDQLDTVIHNPQNIHPDKNFLNSLADQGLKYIIQTFLNNL